MAGDTRELIAALEKYGEHQHHWVPNPVQTHKDGYWHAVVEPTRRTP